MVVHEGSVSTRRESNFGRCEQWCGVPGPGMLWEEGGGLVQGRARGGQGRALRVSTYLKEQSK